MGMKTDPRAFRLREKWIDTLSIHFLKRFLKEAEAWNGCNVNGNSFLKLSNKRICKIFDEGSIHFSAAVYGNLETSLAEKKADS